MLVIIKDDLDRAFMDAKNIAKDATNSWANNKLLNQILDGIYVYLCETVPVIDTETGEIS